MKAADLGSYAGYGTGAGNSMRGGGTPHLPYCSPLASLPVKPDILPSSYQQYAVSQFGTFNLLVTKKIINESYDEFLLV